MPRKVPAPPPPAVEQQPVAGPSSALRRASEKRRFQPARSRRGGPGVGSTPIDEIILDSLSRRHDSDPVVPPTTRFLLTTDSSVAPRVKEASAPPVNAPNDLGEGSSRYFGQTPVAAAAAARVQREIETPEFCLLPEHASVGGRFRARVSEDVGTDTSDAAYEKRHRKYETFEKRQRLREKEKLKHEHYKLKERIEQLRGMDPSAFLSVDAKLFVRDGDPVGEDADAASMDHLQAQAEGERRKVVLLRVAEALEERYATLLNPDAHKTLQGAAFGSSVDGFSQADGDEEGGDEGMDDESDEGEVAEEAAEEDEDVEEGDGEALEEDGPAATEDEDEEVDQLDEDADVDIDEPEPPPPPQNHSSKLRIRLPPRGSLSLSNTPAPSKPPSASSTTAKKSGPRASFMQTTLSASAPPPTGTRKSTRATRARPISNGSVPSNASGPTPPHKRQRLSEPADDHLPPPEADWRQSTLYVFAAQSAPALAARKPVRHLVAFGVKLPEMPHEQEFEVPDFAWPESVPWEYVDDGEEDEAMVEDEVELEVDGDVEVDGAGPSAPAEPASSGRVLRHRPES